MATERTLVLIKPDAMQRGLAGEILGRLERRGLVLRGADLVHVDRDLAERHYEEHREKPFFGELVDFITGGPVVVARLEGESAIEVWRTMMGPTKGGTIPSSVAITTSHGSSMRRRASL